MGIFFLAVHDSLQSLVFFMGGVEMGYRIEYDSSRKHKFYTSRSKRVPLWLVAVILTASLFSIFGNNLKDLLLPGDPQITGAALNSLVEDLRSGEDFADAVTAFCTLVIENAGITQ